jgi:hypothetical protein
MKRGFITASVFLTVLLLLHGTGSAQIYQFSGRVYDGAVGVETTPVSGVTVTLWGANDHNQLNTVIASTTTDANGWYGLNAIRTSWEFFTIVETDPSGYNSTGATSVGGTVITSNQIEYAVSLEGKTLTGNKFWDQKPQQTGNNPPVAEAGGPYSGSTGQPISLDGSGSYDPDAGDCIVQYQWFRRLGNGTYTGIAAPGSNPGLNWVPPGAGQYEVRLTVTDTHGATDSDDATVTITEAGERTGAVYGSKFNDQNGNHQWDAGEPGLSGWTINLTGSNGTATATTDASGQYSFTDVAPGYYTVSETGQSGWTQTCPQSPGTYSIQVAAGQGISDLHFGNTQSGGQQEEKDFGDAPLPYPEASHTLGGCWLGSPLNPPDAESGMQRNTDATGDDADGLDDEDGLQVFGVPLKRGQYCTVKLPIVFQSTENGSYMSQIWIDFNGDGDWTDPGDFIAGAGAAWTAGGAPFSPSTFICSFPVPAGAKIGKTFMRARVCSGQKWPDIGGNLEGGEVEDLEIEILDDGGTPLPSGGIIGGMKFNDQNGNGGLDPGEPGLANWQIWLDSNGNGVLDPGEPETQTDSNGLFAFTGLADGSYLVNETLQSGWVQTTPGSPAGSFPYGVTLKNNKLDPFVSVLFGNCRTRTPGGGGGAVKWNQAPLFHPEFFDEKCYYGWGEPSLEGSATLADDWFCYSKRPVTSFTWWGTYSGWDSIAPPPNAPRMFHIGIWSDTSVTDARPWGHPGRMIRDWTVSRDLVNEQADRCHRMPEWAYQKPDTCFRYTFSIPQPEWFQQPGDSARFWLSVAAVYGEPPGNHVWGWLTRERYFGADAVRIFAPAVPRPDSVFRQGNPLPQVWDQSFVLGTDENTAVMDFGDAADGLGTTWSHNGAHHLIRHDVRMGESIDMEIDGKPDLEGLGDDSSDMDDEDGVAFLDALKPGSSVKASVRVSKHGFLNAWLDRNRNCEWDPGEQVIRNLELGAGNTVVGFPIHDNAVEGPAAMRFRFSTRPDVWVKGFAADGEVEDYMVRIQQSGTEVEEGRNRVNPGVFRMYPNYPNPFNPSTTIRFNLPKASHVRLSICNILGREIRVLEDGKLTEGVHEVRWDGLDVRNNTVPTGVYVVRLEAGAFLGTGKLLLMK